MPVVAKVHEAGLAIVFEPNEVKHFPSEVNSLVIDAAVKITEGLTTKCRPSLSVTYAVGLRIRA